MYQQQQSAIATLELPPTDKRIEDLTNFVIETFDKSKYTNNHNNIIILGPMANIFNHQG